MFQAWYINSRIFIHSAVIKETKFTTSSNSNLSLTCYSNYTSALFKLAEMLYFKVRSSSAPCCDDDRVSGLSCGVNDENLYRRKDCMRECVHACLASGSGGSTYFFFYCACARRRIVVKVSARKAAAVHFSPSKICTPA